MGDLKRELFSLNGIWTIAKDEGNLGKKKGWFKRKPISEARDTNVPSVLEETFHDYDGVVWYWHLKSSIAIPTV